MAMQMFRSPTLAKIVYVLALHEGDEYGVEELAGMVGVARPNALNALRHLEADGVVTHRAVGKKNLYRVEPNHALYPELKGLAIKTFGGQDLVLRALQDDQDVLFVGVYGSVARGEAGPNSDFDILVIVRDENAEEADYRVASTLALASRQLGRPIHPSIHSASAFRELRRSNEVMKAIIRSPMIVLKGELNAL